MSQPFEYSHDVRADEMALDTEQLIDAACRKVGCTAGSANHLDDLFVYEPTYCTTCGQQ